jgi:hypothetical protein
VGAVLLPQATRNPPVSGPCHRASALVHGGLQLPLCSVNEERETSFHAPGAGMELGRHQVIGLMEL